MEDHKLSQAAQTIKAIYDVAVQSGNYKMFKGINGGTLSEYTDDKKLKKMFPVGSIVRCKWSGHLGILMGYNSNDGGIYDKKDYPIVVSPAWCQCNQDFEYSTEQWEVV